LRDRWVGPSLRSQTVARRRPVSIQTRALVLPRCPVRRSLAQLGDCRARRDRAAPCGPTPTVRTVDSPELPPCGPQETHASRWSCGGRGPVPRRWASRVDRVILASLGCVEA
jgi:hypothetical protein